MEEIVQTPSAIISHVPLWYQTPADRSRNLVSKLHDAHLYSVWVLSIFFCLLKLFSALH